QRTFSAEFLNRLDDIVVFHPLSKEELGLILDMHIEELSARLYREHRYSVKLTKDARGAIVEKSQDAKYGARTIRRIIQKEVEDKIAAFVLEDRPPEGSEFLVNSIDNVIRVEVKEMVRQNG
ncbi:MAG: ATP-dependent Clp protease ATP-binding subunit, partial [Spirochaetaceae bacterium]|nr:ATP-dependent Clp protease ATP-binding subunit [Spirochaetaceae bacterium]